MPLGFYVRVLDHKWLLFPDSTVHTVAALTAQATRDAHAQGFLAPNQSLASLQLCLNGSDFVVLSPTSEVSLLVAHCTEEKGAGHDVVLVGQVSCLPGEVVGRCGCPGARQGVGACPRSTRVALATSLLPPLGAGRTSPPPATRPPALPVPPAVWP